MKNYLLLIGLLTGFILNAQTTSDTTFVNTNEVQLDYFGDFDSSVQFPDGSQSYRKIIMTLTMGQYDCPPEAEYCHQWDYTTHIQLLTDSETYDLGQFITPYATTGWPRFGSDWKQPYVFDVTDYYPLLQGEKDVRIHYEGYSGGFTAKIQFAFVEGTPERHVLGIEKAYDMSHTYGDANDPFNDHLETFTATPPAGTENASMKVLVTGHGSDDSGCCEFANHYYSVNLDNTQIAQVDIWRNDCGENDLYPQGGTWIYNRANWCPGSKVVPFIHKLTGISPGSPYNIDVSFQNYNGSGNLGNYQYNATVFYYGENNKNVDAAIAEIMAPTDDPRFYRENPSGSIPKIKVHNTGNTPITSIDFSYGVKDSTQVSYTWNGNIEALKDKNITLPKLETLTNISIEEVDAPQEFQVQITGVNGDQDDDATNNIRSSSFTTAPTWPGNIIAKLKTGSKVVNNQYIYNSGPSDVSWTITDMDGNVVASRTDAQVNSQYSDDIEISESGFYKLKITNDNCVGLHWFPYDGADSYNAGHFKITTTDGTNLPMHNYTYYGTPHDDWGCSYTQYFSVGPDETAGVKDYADKSFQVYPNPAKDYVNIDLKGKTFFPYTVQMFSLQGKMVYQSKINKKHLQIPVNEFSGGLYMLVLKNGKNENQVKKVVIGR